MAIDSKRKGKAGGARVITYTTLVDENTGEVWLIGYVFIDTLRRIPAPCHGACLRSSSIP
mgnify:CR=1 FL=1